MDGDTLKMVPGGMKIIEILSPAEANAMYVWLKLLGANRKPCFM